MFPDHTVTWPRLLPTRLLDVVTLPYPGWQSWLAVDWLIPPTFPATFVPVYVAVITVGLRLRTVTVAVPVTLWLLGPVPVCPRTLVLPHTWLPVPRSDLDVQLRYRPFIYTITFICYRLVIPGCYGRSVTLIYTLISRCCGPFTYIPHTRYLILAFGGPRYTVEICHDRLTFGLTCWITALLVVTVTLFYVRCNLI